MSITNRRQTPFLFPCRILMVFLAIFLWSGSALAVQQRTTQIAIKGNEEALPESLQTAKPTGQIRLYIREGHMLELPRAAAKVLVAAPGVASFQMPAPDKVFLFGQEVGATTFYALDAKGEIIAAVRLVVEYNLESLSNEIASAVPGAQVELEPTLSNLMIVRGKVQTAIDAKRVISLVETYLEAGSSANIKAMAPGGGGGGGGGPRGGPGGSEDDSPSSKTQVINQLQVELSSQINIQVRVVEVSRSLSHEFGFDWRTVLSTSKGAFYFGSGNAQGTTSISDLLPSSSTGGGAFGASLSLGSFTLSGLISALADEGFASLLAEPNLTAMSGESASFAGGGEVPVVLVTNNSINIDYKSYGVILRVTPTVISPNRISLHIAPEVSELTSEGSVTVDNSVIPAMTVRRAETTVELASGQSFALAGMLRSNSSQQVSGIPGLRQIPILGHLFEHEETSVEDSELVIIVTANVVDPVAYADLRTPGKGLPSVDAFLPREASVGYLY